MKKILITGPSGFIGKNLIPYLLKKNFHILTISRKNNYIKGVQNIKCDISEIIKYSAQISNFNPDTVIHLAWQGIPKLNKYNSQKSYEDSKIFFKDILKLKSIKKIISIGSCLEYKIKKGTKVEYEIIDKITPFSKYKNNLRVYLERISKIKKIDFAWLRLFYVYGKNQRKGTLINHILNSIKNKKKIQLSNFLKSNDYIFIEDFNSLINQILKKNKFKTDAYNVGTSKTYHQLEILHSINKILGTAIKGENKAYFKDKIDTFRANILKTKKTFNWKPRYNLNQGLKSIIKDK